MRFGHDRAIEALTQANIPEENTGKKRDRSCAYRAIRTAREPEQIGFRRLIATSR
ncbi:hypothetical protein [Mesorhizobium carmichaelinearum]|uniref:hypothetical protein n=1 Tax=Mesorhizobium carmichaelinearum TaxID=1208188 RepID=UPI0015C979E9|nr:hypothetical protein [Mesorhizobium carmichaelinearum]